MNPPYFSILIPTRNRAALLREALPTVINQTFTDYEIVVSDNNSSDGTRAVVEEFMKQCPRIRYVNPGRDLSMCAHFDYIYQQSKGRYVTYVSDDDGIVPSALAISHEIIESAGVEILVWGRVGIFHLDVPEPAQRGRMWGRVGDGRLYRIPCEIPIKAYEDFEFMPVWGVVPKMLRAVVRRELIDPCAERSGGAFHLPPFPDHSASCQLLATNDCYHLVDLPLYIQGISYNSNSGMGYNRRQKFDDYCNLFEDDLLEGIPFAMRYINASYFHAGIRKFQRLYPESFKGKIDQKRYLEMELEDILVYQRTEDISGELQQLQGYMREYYGNDEFYEKAWAAAKHSRRVADLKGKILEIALASPLLMRVLCAGRRLNAGLRGGQSLDLMDVPSMARAAAIAQSAVDSRYHGGQTWKVDPVQSLGELAALGK